MPIIDLQAKKLRENAVVPKYAHGKEDSGMDLFVASVAVRDKDKKFVESESAVLKSGEVALAKTGWAFAIPVGFEMQIRPTSGNSLKTKIRIPNAPGTIDAGYRDEVGVIIENIGKEDIEIKAGDKIAQAVIAPIYWANIIETPELPNSRRDKNGFGSTGILGKK